MGFTETRARQVLAAFQNVEQAINFLLDERANSDDQASSNQKRKKEMAMSSNQSNNTVSTF